MADGLTRPNAHVTICLLVIVLLCDISGELTIIPRSSAVYLNLCVRSDTHKQEAYPDEYGSHCNASGFQKIWRAKVAGHARRRGRGGCPAQLLRTQLGQLACHDEKGKDNRFRIYSDFCETTDTLKRYSRTKASMALEA